MTRISPLLPLSLLLIANIACDRSKKQAGFDSISANPPASKPFALDAKQSEEFIQIIQAATNSLGDDSILDKKTDDTGSGFVNDIMMVEEIFTPEFGQFVYFKVNKIATGIENIPARNLKKIISAFKENSKNNVRETFPNHEWFELSINARCLKKERLCELFVSQSGGAT